MLSCLAWPRHCAASVGGAARRPAPARRRACRRRCSTRRWPAGRQDPHAGAAAPGGSRGGAAHGARSAAGGSATRSAIRCASIARPGRARASSSSHRRHPAAHAAGRSVPRRRSARVIFDEFHERSLDSDLALGHGPAACSRRCGRSCGIVVMSATLAAEAVSRVSRRLSDRRQRGPAVSRSRSLYEPRPTRAAAGRWPPAQAVERLLARTRGRHARLPAGLAARFARRRSSWKRWPRRATWRCCRCTAICRPSSRTRPCCRRRRRKVVLATNVAETSVTVEGVTGVVDTGLARADGLRSGVGLDRLRADADLAGLGRAARRPGRTDAAGRLRAAVERASHRSRGRSRPSRRFAASISPGRCCSCCAWARRTSTRFPWLEAAAARRRVDAGARRCCGAWARSTTAALTELGRALARCRCIRGSARLLIEGQRLGRARARRPGGRAALRARSVPARDDRRGRRRRAARVVRRARPRRGAGGVRAQRPRPSALGDAEPRRRPLRAACPRSAAAARCGSERSADRRTAVDRRRRGAAARAAGGVSRSAGPAARSRAAARA